MEIEVGEYVRSKIGSIGKVTKIEEDKFLYENRTLITWVGNVIKHSKNIIDLIEVGDYVNEMKIDDIGEIKRFGKTTQKCLWVNIGDGIDIINEEIKDILTKEQYMQNCYTVERKEEC